MRFLDADAVAALGPAAAVRAVTDALRGEVDPAADPPRVSVGLTRGQFLLMPSEAPAAAGVKVVELAGMGPGPYGAMLLGDLGADVLRVDRAGASPATEPEKDVVARSRRSTSRRTGRRPRCRRPSAR